MLEHEFKLLVSKYEYDEILTKFNIKTSNNVQINYYFDTPDLSFNIKNITCRIRKKGGTYTSTIKEHLTNSTESIETNLGNFFNLNDSFKKFNEMGLKFQGILKTFRTVLVKNDLFEIVIDKNLYLSFIDYELEIEYSLKKNPDINQLLFQINQLLPKNNTGLDCKILKKRLSNSESKSQRFFRRKEIYKNLM